MNLIPGSIGPKGDQAILGESLSLPLTTFENFEKGDSPVILGMRPEHLEACETENALMFLQAVSYTHLTLPTKA